MIKAERGFIPAPSMIEITIVVVGGRVELSRATMAHEADRADRIGFCNRLSRESSASQEPSVYISVVLGGNSGGAFSGALRVGISHCSELIPKIFRWIGKSVLPEVIISGPSITIVAI